MWSFKQGQTAHSIALLTFRLTHVVTFLCKYFCHYKSCVFLYSHSSQSLIWIIYKHKRASLMKLAAGLLMAGMADADDIFNDWAPRTGYANSGMIWKPFLNIKRSHTQILSRISMHSVDKNSNHFIGFFKKNASTILRYNGLKSGKILFSRIRVLKYWSTYFLNPRTISVVLSLKSARLVGSEGIWGPGKTEKYYSSPNFQSSGVVSGRPASTFWRSIIVF